MAILFYTGGGDSSCTGLQDFTTWSEVDPNNKITVTSSKVSWAGLSRGEDAWVNKQCSFDGDFEHLLEIKTETDNISFFWNLQNSGDKGSYATYLANEPYLQIYSYYNLGVTSLYLVECFEGSHQSDYTDLLPADTLCYLKIKRDESIGTYGTLTCSLYSSEENRAIDSWYDTLSITLSAKIDFSWIACPITSNTGGPVEGYTDGFTQNLTLQ